MAYLTGYHSNCSFPSKVFCYQKRVNQVSGQMRLHLRQCLCDYLPGIAALVLMVADLNTKSLNGLFLQVV